MITKYLLMLFLVSQLTDVSSSDIKVIPNEDRFLANIHQIVPEGRFHNGSLSPDGMWVCYQGNFVDGGVGDQIWIGQTDGGEPKMLSLGVFPAYDPVFVPLQKKIIFSTAEEINPDHASNFNDRSVSEWLFGIHDLYRADISGTNQIRLTENPGYDGEPAVSKDGATIAFTSFRDNNVDIYLMSSDKSTTRRLTRSPGIDCQPCFTPDDNRIIFAGAESELGTDDGPLETTLPATTLPETTLPATTLPGTGLPVTMPSQQMVSEMKLELFIMNIDGSGRRRLTNLGATSINPTVHPNGEFVVFQSNYDLTRSATKEKKPDFNLFMIALDGSGLQQITFNSWFEHIFKYPIPLALSTRFSR